MQDEHNKIKEGINKTFDKVAKNYDKNEQFIISAKKIVEFVPHDKDESFKILDLSTGTGNIAIELAKSYKNATIYAVDISEQMLNIAKDKAKALNIDNITFYKQDVENLTLNNNEFDIVTCGYGLFFYPNMDETYKNICNIIKPNGKFIFSSFTEDAFKPYTDIFLDLLKNSYNIQPPKRLESRLLKTVKEAKELAVIGNPKDIDVKHFQIRYPLSIDEWWSLLNSTGYEGLLSQLNENYDNFKDDYIESLNKVTKNSEILHNADTLFTIVTI